MHGNRSLVWQVLTASQVRVRGCVGACVGACLHIICGQYILMILREGVSVDRVADREGGQAVGA